jgi:endonuclease/exonuclease/phosphatase family metal-dependent hydrolase
VDLVGLQEVWLGGARQQIIAEARAASDLWHHASLRAGMRDSGLLILSRFPIGEAGFQRFRLTGRPERLAEAEYVAGKGVGYARVHTPAGEVDVYNCHLLAQYTTDAHDPYRAHRTAAAYELVRYVTRHSRTRNPVLLLGDLNMRPDQLGYRMVTCPGGLRDSYRAVHADDPGHTRSDQNPYTPGVARQRIDYIFTKDGATTALKPVASEIIMDQPPPMVQGGVLPAYSDHYGVFSTVELVARRAPDARATGSCGSAAAIWTEFLSDIDAALQDATARQAHHAVHALGSAVLVPGLYLAGRALAVRGTGATTPRAETAGPPPEAHPAPAGATLAHPGAGPRRPIRRRRVLARLVQGIGVVVLAPYALLQGWLGRSIVPREIQHLAAVRGEVLRELEAGDDQR